MSNENGEILSDIANLILVNAEACLEQADLAVPSEVFVSHKRPPDDCCDWMSVWVRQIRPTTKFPATQAVVSPPCGDLVMAVDMTLGIKHGCFPTLKADKAAPFPTGDEMQVAADELAIIARTLWCCLLAAQAAGQLLPRWPLEIGEQLGIVWGPMTPTRGGGCAGWDWDFVVELPACCWEAPPLPGSGSGS